MKRAITWAIAISLLACAVVTVVSLLQPIRYEASAKVYVDVRSTECSRSESGAEARICPIPLAPSASLTRLATQEVRIDGPSVAKEAIKEGQDLRMPPGYLLNNLRVGRSEPFIELSYTDTDPKRAKEVAFTVGRIAAEHINQEDGAKLALKLPPDTDLGAAVFDGPKASLVSPKPVRNGLITLVGGLVLSALLIAVRESW
jgi:capsular polysaccharide biosynthesis protein